MFSKTFYYSGYITINSHYINQTNIVLQKECREVPISGSESHRLAFLLEMIDALTHFSRFYSSGHSVFLSMRLFSISHCGFVIRFI